MDVSKLISDFKPSNTPDSLDLPGVTCKETRELIYHLLLQHHFARTKATRLEAENEGLKKEVRELTCALKQNSSISRVMFWSAIGGLALFLVTCFVVTWTTRPSVKELREATRHHSVAEVLREVAPNGVTSLKDASLKLGFEIIKTPTGEIYISLKKE